MKICFFSLINKKIYIYIYLFIYLFIYFIQNYSKLQKKIMALYNIIKKPHYDKYNREMQ